MRVWTRSTYTILMAIALPVVAAIIVAITTSGESWLVAVLAGVAIVLTLFFSLFTFQVLIERFAVARSHIVAVVGFPKSGKTTLIVSLFGETFAGKTGLIRMMPKGTQTIERINASLEMLKKGKALGPTKDQDRFAFRALLTVGGVFRRTYKVEFGDFPGDDSEAYAERYGPWLHNTEFFKWVAESDAIVFVIDLGRYLAGNQERIAYIARMSSAIRAAWQYFLDVNDQRTRQARRHPVVLAFNKADLFGVIESRDSNSRESDNFGRMIASLAFGDETPPINVINPQMLEAAQKRVTADFGDLINFLRTEAPKFRVVFTSSFGLENGRLLGITELLRATLPGYS